MFLRTDFQSGMPVRVVCDPQNLNRMANILEGIEGVGCRIVRNYSAEGKGWKIVVDGSSDAGQLPGGVRTSDRLFAVDSVSTGKLGRDNFTGSDSVGFDSLCLHIRHDICADSVFSGVPYRRLRMYLRTAGVSTTPTHILGLNSSGQVVLVAVTDTCAPPA